MNAIVAAGERPDLLRAMASEQQHEADQGIALLEPVPVAVRLFRPYCSNTVRGFADVELPFGLLLRSVTVHSKDGEVWARPPRVPDLRPDGTLIRRGDGRARYVRVVTFATPEARLAVLRSRAERAAPVAPRRTGGGAAVSALSDSERTRLAKLLGMLGSDHDGERAAAALAASRFVRARGVTWPQVLRPPAVEKPLPELGAWRQTAARCLERRDLLRPWEIRFLSDLPGFRRLSVKQRYVLQEIAERVLGGEACP